MHMASSPQHTQTCRLPSLVSATQPSTLSSPRSAAPSTSRQQQQQRLSRRHDSNDNTPPVRQQQHTLHRHSSPLPSPLQQHQQQQRRALLSRKRMSSTASSSSSAVAAAMTLWRSVEEGAAHVAHAHRHGATALCGDDVAAGVAALAHALAAHAALCTSIHDTSHAASAAAAIATTRLPPPSSWLTVLLPWPLLWQQATMCVLHVTHALLRRAAAATPLTQLRHCYRLALDRLFAAAPSHSTATAAAAVTTTRTTTAATTSLTGRDSARRKQRHSVAGGGGDGRSVVAAAVAAAAQPAEDDEVTRRVAFFISATHHSHKDDADDDTIALGRVLRATLLSNCAAAERTSDVTCVSRVLRLLQQALAMSGGVLCTHVLYNIGVIYVACARFDDAAAALTHCLALCSAYLHLCAHDKDSGNDDEYADDVYDDDDGDDSMYKSEGRGVHDTAAARRALRSMAAVHAVKAHLLFALLAQWCGQHGVAVQQCQLACGCAQTHLSPQHTLQRHCAQRLAAAMAQYAQEEQQKQDEEEQQRQHVAVRDDEDDEDVRVATLPQLPLLTCCLDALFDDDDKDDDAARVVAAAATTAAPYEPDAVSRVQTATAAMTPSSLTCCVCTPPTAWRGVYALVRLARRVALSPPLHMYVQAARDCVASTHTRTAATRTTAAASSASAATRRLRLPSLSASALWPSTQLAASSSPLSPTRVAASSSAAATRDATATSPMTSRRGSLRSRRHSAACTPRGGGGVVTPCVVTVLGSAAYTRYTLLKRQTPVTLSRLCASAARARRDGDDEQANNDTALRGVSAVTAATTTTTDGDSTVATEAATTPPSPGAAAGQDVAALSASQYARSMDRRLRHFSRVCGDAAASRRRCAAAVIQRAWRCAMARRRVRRRAAQAEQWRCRSEAAWRIAQCYRDYRACARARDEAAARRTARHRAAAAATLRAFVSAQQSWRVVLARHTHRLLCLQLTLAQQQLRHTAATRVQACWRRCRARAALRARQAAAVRVQCAWRQFAARRELRRRRLHARLRHEAWLRACTPRAVLLQRWWRACVLRRAVREELPRRRAAVLACVCAQEAQYAAVCARVQATAAAAARCCGGGGHDDSDDGDVVDVHVCVQRVLAVLRGAQARRQLRTRYAYVCVVRRALLSWLLRRRGRVLLARMHDARDARRARQRREAAAHDAAVRLQCVVRQWCARRACARRAAAAQHARVYGDAAVVLQRAWRAHRGASHDDAVKPRPCARDVVGDVSPCVRTSLSLSAWRAAACVVQRAWRRHAAACARARWLRFMLHERHDYATRVQRVWRGYHVRRTLSRCSSSSNKPRSHTRSRGDDGVCDGVAVQQQQQQAVAQRYCAVVLLQSVARMFLARRRAAAVVCTSAAAVCNRLPPSQWQRQCAARCIQTAWRAVVARRVVLQCRVARAVQQKDRAAREAVHAYATVAQSFVRMCCVQQRRRQQDQQQQQQQQQHDADDDKDAAARVLQRAWRHWRQAVQQQQQQQQQLQGGELLTSAHDESDIVTTRVSTTRSLDVDVHVTVTYRRVVSHTM